MILRRFIKHVSDQNWFAVGLDVLVVIVGIFLGMQVTDRYEEQKDEEALDRSLSRLAAEAQDNIAILSAYYEEFSVRDAKVERNFRTLLACSADPGDVKFFNDNLHLVAGSRVPQMQIDALVDVTEKDRYTNILDDDLLASLNRYKRTVLSALKEAEDNDDIAWNNMPYRQEVVGMAGGNPHTYGGSRYVLTMPFSQACKVEDFRKAYLDYSLVLHLNAGYASNLLEETRSLVDYLQEARR